MKTQFTTNMLIFTFATLGVTISSGVTSSAAEFSDIDVNTIPSILNMIADSIQNNYSRIKTWEGEAKSQLQYIYDGKAAERVFKSNTNGIGQPPLAIINSAKSTVEFSMDAEKDSLFAYNYFNKPVEYRDLATGKDLGASGTSGEEKAILTKDAYIRYRASRMRNGVITSHKATKENRKDCTGCQTLPVFDPREGFYAGQSCPKTLRHLAERIKLAVDGRTMKVQERSNHNSLDYRVITPAKSDGMIVFTSMVFSGEKGYNLVSLELADANGRVYQSGTWDYETKEGIYLPKETTQQNYMRKDGGLSYSKKMTFNNLRVNQPISPETFTLTNLGLKNGDIFEDRIQGKKYQYQDKMLVSIADANK
jgi:hypothetical protein